MDIGTLSLSFVEPSSRLAGFRPRRPCPRRRSINYQPPTAKIQSKARWLIGSWRLEIGSWRSAALSAATAAGLFSCRHSRCALEYRFDPDPFSSPRPNSSWIRCGCSSLRRQPCAEERSSSLLQRTPSSRRPAPSAHRRRTSSFSRRRTLCAPPQRTLPCEPQPSRLWPICHRQPPGRTRRTRLPRSLPRRPRASRRRQAGPPGRPHPRCRGRHRSPCRVVVIVVHVRAQREIIVFICHVADPSRADGSQHTRHPLKQSTPRRALTLPGTINSVSP